MIFILKSIIMFIKKPLYQFIIVSGLMPITMIINRLLGIPGNEWLLGVLGLLVFEIANPIIGIFVQKRWRYTGISALYFMGLFLISIVLPTIISVWSMEDLRESAMIYLVIMYYPIFICICGIIKAIIQFAKNKKGNG